MSHFNLGRKHTLESRLKISASHMGKKRSLATRQKISENKKNYYKTHKSILLGKPSLTLGMKHSEATKLKISQSHLARKSMLGYIDTLPIGSKCRFWKGGISKQPGYKNHHWALRELRVLGVPGTHTITEWELLKKQCGNRCLCCKKYEPEIKLTKDHIIPIVKGGSNFIENIQPLCLSCNSKKHTKSTKYYLEAEIESSEV